MLASGSRGLDQALTGSCVPFLEKDTSLLQSPSPLMSVNGCKQTLKGGIPDKKARGEIAMVQHPIQGKRTNSTLSYTRETFIKTSTDEQFGF